MFGVIISAIDNKRKAKLLREGKAAVAYVDWEDV